MYWRSNSRLPFSKQDSFSSHFFVYPVCFCYLPVAQPCITNFHRRSFPLYDKFHIATHILWRALKSKGAQSCIICPIAKGKSWIGLLTRVKTKKSEILLLLWERASGGGEKKSALMWKAATLESLLCMLLGHVALGLFETRTQLARGAHSNAFSTWISS
jgi:hypothetical protein